MFAVIRSKRALSEPCPGEQFDLVLDMLAGRYAGSRVRELKPRIAYDRIDGTVRANKAAPCSPCTTPAEPFPTGATTSSAMPIPAP